MPPVPPSSYTYDLQAQFLYVILHFYDPTVSLIWSFLSDFGWTTLKNWTVNNIILCYFCFT